MLLVKALTQPVAVTGVGLVFSGGTSAEDLWWAVQGPELPPSWCRELSGAETRLWAARQITAPLPLPQPPVIRRQHRADRMVQLALVAAAQAWDSAGLSRDMAEGAAESAVGIVVGSSRGPVGKWTEIFADPKAVARPRPTWAGESSLAALHGALGALIGATGPALTVSTACASGGHAVALAASLIVAGQVEYVLAGGADAPLEPIMLRQMAATGILDVRPPEQRPCRPFDQEAAGTLMGEGAAFLVLESLASARRRGVPRWGLLVGWGMAGDGRSASPESAGAIALEQAVHRAVCGAGLAPTDIAYVNCHGTGTVVNDALESQWLQQLQVKRGRAVAYSSSKAATGHCLGATPVMEAILCLEALRRRELPRTPHSRVPAAYAPAGLVLEAGQPMSEGAALSVSLGFWGASVALLFARDSG